jgi:UDP-N-acetylglucosamine acyltransferase
MLDRPQPQNEISSSAEIIGQVTLGFGNKILPHTILIGPLTIGDNNIIGPHVVIGTPGADTRAPKADSSEKLVKIGSGNIIREFSSIQKGCYTQQTTIGDNCYVMPSSTIQHDCLLESESVVAAGATLGGSVSVLRGAYIAMNCSVHQRCVVGQYSIVGMGAPLLKDVRPFSRYVPGKTATVNHYAISKFGFANFTAEIEDYVLKNIYPTEPTLRAIVDQFDTARKNSGLKIY